MPALKRGAAERRRWLSSPAVDAETKEALCAQGETEAESSFRQPLSFGTGGLRQLMGPGINRMNAYTVRQATRGLAAWMRASGAPLHVAIAYDSRVDSEAFAREAARVLALCGITAHLYPRLQPTPALSFAVRHLGCGAGICVTASHNPAAYNGYKVYGADGGQITPENARAIQREIAQHDVLWAASGSSFDECVRDGRIRWIPESVLDAYLEAVHGLSAAEPGAPPLRVVYTPLNGAGRECVLRILSRMDGVDVCVVAEQAMPDGRFPTCPEPNPETTGALSLGLRDCARTGADLLLATDPDCDRVGVAARDDAGGYRILSGDEVGALLLSYLCTVRQAAGSMPQAAVAVTTIVSGEMADAVATRHGVQLQRTLTGFKYIGEALSRLAAAGEADRFLLGFEESCGYLSGAHVRDKDGVNAAMLICEMARYHKRQGLSLPAAMERLYQAHGYRLSALDSYAFAGPDGISAQAAVMHRLRTAPPGEIGGVPVLSVKDYLLCDTGLPPADVVSLRLAGDGMVTMRPSGTEPKLKAYVFARGETRASAAEAMRRLRTGAAEMVRTSADGGRE